MLQTAGPTEVAISHESAAPNEQRLDRMLASGLRSLMAGAIAGYWSSLLVPHRVLPRLTVDGPSVVLAPLCAGLAMHVFGPDFRS